MPEKYKVQPGDCIPSIAFERGFFPDTIWKHPDNSALKNLRKDMNVLLAGDEVTIPDKRVVDVEKPPEKRHRFRRKGVPKQLRIQLIDIDKPVANMGYQILIDGVRSSGTTDGDGWLKHSLPPNAKVATLIYDNGMQYELDLGHMDPVDELSGVQKRLKNLGFYGGEIDGRLNEGTAVALREFQGGNGLQVTGQADAATKDKLKERAGA